MTLFLQTVLLALVFAAAAVLLVQVRRAERFEREVVERQRGRFESDFDALVQKLEAASAAAQKTPAVVRPAAPPGEAEPHREHRRKKRSKGGRRPRRS